jgi:hypothetical protein
LSLGIAVVLRIEAVGVDRAQIVQHVLGARAGRALRHPQRLEAAALLVERDDCIALGLARDHAVELLAGDDLAKLVADIGLARGVRRGSNGGRACRALGRSCSNGSRRGDGASGALGHWSGDGGEWRARASERRRDG